MVVAVAAAAAVAVVVVVVIIIMVMMILAFKSVFLIFTALRPRNLPQLMSKYSYSLSPPCTCVRCS